MLYNQVSYMPHRCSLGHGKKVMNYGKLIIKCGDILWGPRYTPLVALKGEIGTSPDWSRDLKNKLMLTAQLLITGWLAGCSDCEGLGGKKQPMGEAGGGIYEGHWSWYCRLEEYEKNKKIKLKVDEWQEERWRSRVEARETLSIHRSKTRIEDEKK